MTATGNRCPSLIVGSPCREAVAPVGRDLRLSTGGRDVRSPGCIRAARSRRDRDGGRRLLRDVAPRPRGARYFDARYFYAPCLNAPCLNARCLNARCLRASCPDPRPAAAPSAAVQMVTVQIFTVQMVTVQMADVAPSDRPGSSRLDLTELPAARNLFARPSRHGELPRAPCRARSWSLASDSARGGHAPCGPSGDRDRTRGRGHGASHRGFPTTNAPGCERGLEWQATERP